MRISVLVQGSPWTTRACHNALEFVRAVAKSEHELYRVFFYQDAVGIAHSHVEVSVDEPNLQEAWLELSNSTQVELAICVSAASRRGLVQTKEIDTVKEGFTVVGLGQLVDAMLESERLVSFSA